MLKKILILQIILISIIIQPSPAFSTVTYDGSYPRISITSGSYDMQSLYDELVSIYGKSNVRQDILNETEDGTWIAKAYISAGTYPNSLYINDTECNELRLDNSYSSWSLTGNINIDNTKIASWNSTYNNYTENEESKRSVRSGK